MDKYIDKRLRQAKFLGLVLFFQPHIVANAPPPTMHFIFRHLMIKKFSFILLWNSLSIINDGISILEYGEDWGTMLVQSPMDVHVASFFSNVSQEQIAVCT